MNTQAIDAAENSLQRIQKYLDRLAIAKGYHKERIHSFIDKNGHEIPLLVADLKALLQQVATTHPTKQGLDAAEWGEIHTLPTCDDLIWLYCQDTNTVDGPIAPEPSLEQYGWTHWAYANAPSTAWIDAAHAKRGRPCKNCNKDTL